MVTDKLYCVDLLAKLLDSSLTCDIISSPNSTVKDGIHILDYLTACRTAFLTSIFSQKNTKSFIKCVTYGFQYFRHGLHPRRPSKIVKFNAMVFVENILFLVRNCFYFGQSMNERWRSRWKTMVEVNTKFIYNITESHNFIWLIHWVSETRCGLT